MADPIDRVASAVSNGDAVDWVREKSSRPHLLEPLEQLAVVEGIRRVHGAAASSQSTPEESTAAADTRVLPAAAPAGGPPAPTPPLFRWGRLEVLEEVDEGGGGKVYRALDTALNAEVALKLLRLDYADSPHLVQDFLEEARRLARVRHHNVLVVHGADQNDGRIGLWTEFVRGQTLEATIAAQGPMSACEAALIGLDLCRALAAVHAAGLIHRDVKTTNVMRESGGRIVLMDFGSVAETRGMDAGSGAWTAGVQGTPLYMAPEQLQGEVAGPATDLYGLGVLLYRLVTRRYPIEASSLSELREKHQRREQVPLRDRRADLPLEFVQVVDRALRHDPADRYVSVGAIEQDLAQTLGAMARREERRRRFQGITIGGVAAAAVVVGLLIGGGRRHEDRLASRADGSAPIASTRAPLSAEAALMRRSGDNEEPLGSGARIEPGNRLSLLLRNSDSMYVYVLNEDAGGEVNGLYPIPGLVPANPLQGRMQHRLPGDLGGEVVYWNVTSAVGKETILAIGSRRPLQDLEAAMASFPKAMPGRPIRFGKVNPMALRTLRGIESGTPLTPPAGEAKRRLEAAVRALEEEGRKTGDVWVWSIDLENPPAP